MNEAGVLGRFIPDFGRIVAMMQFNMYHHFTLDEHLIRTVGVVAEIERGDADKIHPLSHRIFKSITIAGRYTSQLFCTTSARAAWKTIPSRALASRDGLQEGSASRMTKSARSCG